MRNLFRLLPTISSSKFHIMKLSRSLFPSLVILASCIEPFEPDLHSDTFNILVVDGFINSTNNSATVRFSRAVSLSEEVPPSQDIVATVNIEDEAGTTFTLNNQGLGYYSLENIALDNSRKYRLHIYSQFDEEILSDFIELKDTPPIDSVVWRPDKDGISIYVNTHDPGAKSRYYSWNYTETWEYTSTFFSTYKLIDGEAYSRTPEEYIYSCWSTERSTDILVGSTSLLSDDVVRDFPLTYIPGESSKLTLRYSIEVEQRVLTQEAYDFWIQLEKTTESLGGLFDPLPSQVLGNIRSSGTVSTDPVLGYFSGGSVNKQRIFVDFADLPYNIISIYRPRRCVLEDVSSIAVGELPNTPNSVLLIDPVYVQGVGIVAYTTAANYCIDCRMAGGTNKRPEFW